ncbi:MAG: tetratricopeptide repeat protein [Methanobacterium sp.]
MDAFILLGAMLLAYGGIILVYYRLRAKEQESKISNFMLKGIMSMRRGNLDKSLFYFNNAYECSINTDDIGDAAEALYYAGKIYSEQGEIDTALECWENADSLYLEINNTEGIEKIQNAIKSVR